MSPSPSPGFKNPRAKYDFQGRTCSISGVGAYVPAKVLTNAELERLVDTTDEWITSRTGIKERRIAAKNEFTSDLAMQAALRHPVRWTFDDYDAPRSGTVKDLIEACLDHGYRVLTPRKHGAFTDYQLGDGRTGYIFRKKLEIEYIRTRLAELNAV